jgi:hypothetical protein
MFPHKIKQHSHRLVCQDFPGVVVVLHWLQSHFPVYVHLFPLRGQVYLVIYAVRHHSALTPIGSPPSGAQLTRLPC